MKAQDSYSATIPFRSLVHNTHVVLLSYSGNHPGAMHGFTVFTPICVQNLG